MVAGVSNSLSLIQFTDFCLASYLDLILFIQTLHSFHDYKYKLASDLIIFFLFINYVEWSEQSLMGNGTCVSLCIYPMNVGRWVSGCQREKVGKVDVADFLTVKEESDLRVCFALCYTWWREKRERRGQKGQNEEEADAEGECIKMVKNYRFILKQPGVN